MSTYMYIFIKETLVIRLSLLYANHCSSTLCDFIISDVLS